MGDLFHYLFRFCCDPGFNDKKEIKALEHFVDEALIDDVMVFANVEEINIGHMTFSEQDKYLEMMKEVQDMLSSKSVTMSVNQWHSLMHADLGKKLNDGQNFRLMVDPYGNRASLCVCPLCGEWRKYITQLYSRYATLSPNMVWVEDDFRLHNHDPLIWGGCFCEEHMKLYSKLAGKELTREEFVEGILKKGEVHPYRQIWLDVSSKAMVENANLIGNAVHEINPNIRVGLMSSAPHIHCAEGRDWSGILKGLSGETVPPVNRIHLPGYVEPSPSVYMLNFNAVSMLTRAMIPKETEVYPELENFPYSRFTKSRKFTRFQLLSAMPLNLSGMTIDLYDLNGNGIVWEEGYQNTLKKTKPYLNRLTETGIFKSQLEGVKVMYDEKSSYTLHTHDGKSMEELYPQEMFFGSLLPAFGIPCTFCSDRTLQNEIVAISGQYLRNLNKAEITSLIKSNFVILDSTAAMTLWDLGLGELANIENAKWEIQNSGSYAYEQVENEKSYCGMENARSSAIILCSDVLNISYSKKVQAITGMYNSYRERTMAGLTLANKNTLIYPFGNFQSFPEMPRMLLNNIRQALMQDMIASASEYTDTDGKYKVPPFIVGEPYINPYYYKTQTGFALYLVNAGTDDCEVITLNIGKHAVKHIEAISSLDNERKTISFLPENDIIKINLPLFSMETALLFFE